MSERDELRLSLLGLGGSISACWSRLDVAGPFDQEKAESAIDAAVEVILAAGCRKPRTITTAEELDALPVGSVVLSDSYRHSIGEWPVSFQRWGDGDWHRGARSGDTHPDNFLPVTVLHEGTQP